MVKRQNFVGVRTKENQRLRKIEGNLQRFLADSGQQGSLRSDQIEVLSAQVVDSLRREEYVYLLRERPLSEKVSDPRSNAFDPVKGAIYFAREGEFDNACWLVFLSTHFGKHGIDHWRLCQDIYGGLGSKTWSWDVFSTEHSSFLSWLGESKERLKGSDGIKRRFGNHRKYESVKPECTGRTLGSYRELVLTCNDHCGLFTSITEQATESGDPFDLLYEKIGGIWRFGRTAKFDFVTMLGKVGLIDFFPTSPYLKGSTGPLIGARMIFGSDLTIKEGNTKLVAMGKALGVGMQAIEDSVCNWQKSPNRYIGFRG